jgi:hypothetical protein
MKQYKQYKTNSFNSTLLSSSGNKSVTKANYQFQNYESELLQDDLTS